MDWGRCPANGVAVLTAIRNLKTQISEVEVVVCSIFIYPFDYFYFSDLRSEISDGRLFSWMCNY